MKQGWLRMRKSEKDCNWKTCKIRLNISKIEITSWKARAYGIFTRVGEVSEIERVSAANEWDFWYKTNECENPVQSAFHAVICLFYTYWDFFGGISSILLLSFLELRNSVSKLTSLRVFERVFLFFWSSINLSIGLSRDTNLLDCSAILKNTS